MALSQIQCLDDNHVNWRLNESKPEFFYSEDQRLALEALIQEGRDAFEKHIQEHKVRQFLSEIELEKLSRTAEEYKPGSEHLKGDGVGDSEDGAVSLQYWPERSDISIPNLDMGWPDCSSYRGVTRVNVYTQPPMEGQTHIKEVVRKTIVQAQKVIAVVMDLFTDVDIFKDLLDASFKRKVAVYIILDVGGVPHFLSMCERAGMHRGHLKNLRVRCCGGSEFYTRSSRKVRGSLSQKFMFVDGDRTVCGSYSFTWTGSRLDKNLITVLTGQAVETFDKQFRELYLMSRGVNLSKVNLGDEPEPEPVPQVAPVPPPSAAMVRKLINPKYALVTSNAAETASGASSGKNSAKNCSSTTPMLKEAKKKTKEPEDPPLHPGLVGLERANLIPYLPTWPEPDPPSDVIGFINIRDSNKPVQVHLMRSERFETSQAIRFKSPFVPTEESLPDKATLRQKPEIPPANPPAVQVEKSAPPQAQPEPKPKPVPQKIQDETDKSPQPSDQKKNPEPNKQEKESMPPPPVPKPRTVQLVINNAGCQNGPSVTLVKKPSIEMEIPQTSQNPGPTPTSDSGEPSSPPDNAPTSVTDPDDPASEDAGGGRDVEEDDQEEELKEIRTEADSNEVDSMEASQGQSPRDESNASTPSDEYFECTESDILESTLMANGGLTGSGRLEDLKHTDGLNVMARFSQSMLDLRPESKQQLQQKEEDSQRVLAALAALQRSQIRMHYGNGKKLYQTSSRAHPVSSRGNLGTAKVVIAKPGSYHRPAKAAGHVIGGHKYWQGKLFNQDKVASGRCSPSRLAQMQLANSRTGRSPSRHSSPHRPHAVLQGDSRTPLGIPITKVSQFKHLKGKISGNPIQKKAQLGNK